MINQAITNHTIEIVSRHGFAEILQNTVTNQKSLHAIFPFKKGDVISNFSAGEIYDAPNYLTVQRGISEHITLMPQFLQYINHSCNPNVFFDTSSMEVIALTDIEPNEEFSFFYPSTEWEMSQSFLCNCGNKDCLQLINGASHLSAETLSKYRLTDFIKQQAKQKQLL